ncbi:MarR family winged helix-turn-helix transcriptional regulator [Rhodococcoides kyotonense]|uniref:DNA-binding transcriptional regulator, MarR family n=1 Tax=Rhodococcoides kyotonense TaxID=398843 RepID=A0A239L6K1_9NOCA|nr:helix-turn-helix domain-containing protein [Rhodococcus kyotonensis]SNT25955.1 DNA-binding transcriptional regulator, MarR family [Rhodococcus kyotonensis]
MRTSAGDALTELVLPAFELNGEFLAAAKDIAEPAGLTPAWWQVLGATLDEPLAVAEIARRVGLGLARQSVQRTADILVEKGWAEYVDNPKHRRAKFLKPTTAGRATLGKLKNDQHAWADAVGKEVGLEELEQVRESIARIVAASRRYRGDSAV